jgi:hypothetical protein
MFQAFVDRALAMWFGQMPTRVGGSERPTAPESIERPTAPDPDRRYRAEAATIPFQPEAPTRSFVSADRVRPVSRTATLESPSIRASAAPSEKTFPVPSEPAPEPQVPASPSGQKPRPPVVLLTQKKKTPDPERYASVVPLRGDDTLKTEAVAAVPEVASVLAPAPPPAERSEDGHAPAHELDRVMNEMKVLLDYGHRQQVRTKIQDFCRRYPEDLLLLRRVAEFYLENNDRSAAMETLFCSRAGSSSAATSKACAARSSRCWCSTRRTSARSASSVSSTSARRRAPADSSLPHGSWLHQSAGSSGKGKLTVCVNVTPPANTRFMSMRQS